VLILSIRFFGNYTSDIPEIFSLLV